MNAALAGSTSPERPGSTPELEVFARDYKGGVKRISLSVADELVNHRLADRASTAGHVALKPGITIASLDRYSGARPSQTTIGNTYTKRPHPRCHKWNNRYE